MASRRHATTMENLPDEVLSEIFIQLLAKQLAQMKCVCKSWKTLLSDSSFIKSHLHHTIHHNDDILLFFHSGFYFDCNPLTVCPSRSPNLDLTISIKPPVNLRCKQGKVYGSVIGSVNGLICFYYISHSSRFHDYVVYIWNPSLSVVLTLPPFSLPAGDSSELHFRFGFDPKTDDYKAIKLTALSGTHRVVLEAEVYSMRKGGSWESISHRFPSNITMNSHDYDDVCVEGHVHWLCYTHLSGKSQTMVAFDLGAETFHEIPLPHSILDDYGYRCNELGVLGGKLCVMSRVVRDGLFEVWVMDEYGVAESWFKHHAFSHFNGGITPYRFTLHNEFLFKVGGDSFGLYDPVATKTKTFKTKGLFGITKVVEYVDSLVWVAPADNISRL